MRILHIDLRPLDTDYADLRYGWENPNDFQSRRLPLAEIQDLIDRMERDYYVALPEDYAKTGQRLYQWLDGTDRWLGQLIDGAQAGVVLAMAAKARLAHLPWEVLHDGQRFLVARLNPVVVPVRWQGAPLTWADAEVPNRPLQTLFMATSPVGVAPVLDFELEEGRILEATQRQPLTLTVEESGCLDELANLLTSYGEDHFDVVHLTGHAWIADEGPRFITETETGDRHDASPQAIAKALQFRFPALMFLSGCRTGQMGHGGEVPSMAAALLDAGATAVLGWGRPVLDTDGIQAAETLYAALAAAKKLPEAVALTYQAMIEAQARDWHLLRLYLTGQIPQNLVTPLKTRGRKRAPKPSMATDFLDAAGTVKVPTRGSFVGRRRPLQACLRALQDPDTVGVLIYGMGGLGKSSLAARLCDRLHDFERVVWVGPLDEAGLVNRLAERVRDRELRQHLQDPNEDLKYRLRDLLEAETEQPFLLVLDDFEANLEPVGDSFRLMPDGAKVLGALSWAIEETGVGHRVVITCRYDFDFTGLTQFHKQPLARLQAADLNKKCQQMEAFREKSAIEKPLRERALRLADGNPRLLEWLDKILRNPAEIQQGSPTAVLDKLEDKPTELREKVLAETLLALMDEPLQQMLSDAMVYELPVPKEAISAVCKEISNVDALIDRAVALGLLEQSPDGALRVPRVLPLAVPESEGLAAQAAGVLYRVWWEEAESSSEAQRLEIHRLAVMGEMGEIGGEIATNLSRQWTQSSRYREVVSLCESTFEVSQVSGFLHEQGIAYANLGEVTKAANSYQKSLESCSEDDEIQKAATLHCLAMLKADQGDVAGAIALYEDSLAIKEKIGDVQGKAATLHQLAMLKANQGDVAGAIALYEDSLAIKEKIGNVQGKAATLHNLASLKANQGDVAGAIALYEDSLAIEEKIGNVKGKAATLHCLAILKANQGDVAGAIEMFQESLAIEKQIGNVQGQAITLWWLGGLAANAQNNPDQALIYLQDACDILQRIGSPKAAQVQQLIEQVQAQTRPPID
ncbi:MAG: tetratricopeptide repeat protein [Cyanobacteria bacterium J06635_1]